jgi:23S rRNA pseudouridine1911/1915/1917 synthase
MRELSFTVPIEYNGITVKSFLRNYCKVSSRLMIKLKREPMGITNNGVHTIVTDMLAAGDVIKLCIPQDEKMIEPVNLPLNVLYEDRDVLIIDKPADMPMYPAPRHDCDSLANAVSAYYQNNNEKISFRPVYRLDKDTTGIVVIAKNSYSAARLSGKIDKEYIAICEGKLNGSGIFCDPIGLKQGHCIQREVTKSGEKAITNWKVISNSENHSLVYIKLETGRTHQIRVHFSHYNHPLAGDDMYGGSLSYISRQALHCAKISFIHPVTGKKLKFESGFPKDMQSLILKCCLKINK